MMSLGRMLRTRIALRSAAITLAVVGLIGVISLVVATLVSERREQQREYNRLNQLLDTVQQTVQIACFLNNRELAKEVADGLLSNRTVSAVHIEHAGASLADSGRGGAAQSIEPVNRKVNSPFDDSEEICEISLLPDAEEIRSSVLEASTFVSLLLSMQLLGIGVVVVLVIITFVTRPIRRVSLRLNQLEAQTGQKLKAPRGNEQDEIGSLVASVNAMIDRLVNAIRVERELRLERELEERRFRTIFENVETGIFELDGAGRIVEANPAFRRMFGLPDSDSNAVARSALRDLVDEPEPLDRALQALETDAMTTHVELSVEAGDQRRWLSVLFNRIEAERMQGVANDITERHLAAEAAEQMAVTDSLTGLGNRRGLDWRLAAATRVLQNDPDYRAALILLDLDHFKEANDTYGHAVGDEVLQHVGRVLSELVRKADYVARLGGDEFVILLDGVSARNEVIGIVERFLLRVNQPLCFDDVTVRIGASLGIAVLGEDANSEQELIRMADAAMYQAKHSGRNTYRFHKARSNQPWEA